MKKILFLLALVALMTACGLKEENAKVDSTGFLQSAQQEDIVVNWKKSAVIRAEKYVYKDYEASPSQKIILLEDETQFIIGPERGGGWDENNYKVSLALEGDTIEYAHGKEGKIIFNKLILKKK